MILGERVPALRPRSFDKRGVVMENPVGVAPTFFNTRNMPGWATSTIVHAVVLTILLFIPMNPSPKIEEIVVEQETINLPNESEIVQDIQQPAEIIPEPQTLASDAPTPAPSVETAAAGGDTA